MYVSPPFGLTTTLTAPWNTPVHSHPGAFSTQIQFIDSKACPVFRCSLGSFSSWKPIDPTLWRLRNKLRGFACVRTTISYSNAPLQYLVEKFWWRKAVAPSSMLNVIALTRECFLETLSPPLAKSKLPRWASKETYEMPDPIIQHSGPHIKPFFFD